MNINTTIAIKTLALAAALSVAGVACTEQGDDDEEPTETAQAELAAEGEQPHDEFVETDPVDDGEREAPRVAEPTLDDVDEEAVDEAPTFDASALDAESAARLDDIDLPVMLPDDDELLAAGDLYGVDHTYTFTVHVDDEDGERDHSISIRGSRMKPDLPEHAEADAEEGEYRISETHLVQTLAFDRFNVAYSIDLECNRPHENETCSGHDAIRSIADSLKVVSGGDR